MKWFDKLFKKSDNGQKTSPMVFWGIAITVLFLIYAVFSREIGAINWLKNRLVLNQQNKEIVRYHNEIDQMDKKIKMLSTDKDTLEQFARENFLFASPGEDVYLVPEED